MKTFFYILTVFVICIQISSCGRECDRPTSRSHNRDTFDLHTFYPKGTYNGIKGSKWTFNVDSTATLTYKVGDSTYEFTYKVKSKEKVLSYQIKYDIK